MSAVEHVPSASRALPLRPFAVVAGLACAAAVALLARICAPGAPFSLAIGLALVPAAGVGLLAALAKEAEQPRLVIEALLGAALALLGALIPAAEPRLLLFGLAMLAILVGLAVWLARTAPRGLAVPPLLLLAWLIAAALIAAWSAWFIVVSQDLEIADFMTYRRLSVAVATMIDGGQIPLALAALVGSIKEDYSWFAAVGPALIMAATSPLSRVVYTVALVALYGAPATLALALLARDLARRAGLPAAVASSPAALALGMAAVCVVYPVGLAATARGMPDIGGLALVFVALRLADTLARLLALPRGRAERVASQTSRITLALALALFAMFAFRRWYLFAAAGIVAVLALEVGAVVLRRPKAFRWREAGVAAALGALTLFALASPVLVDWLPNLAVHNYGETYAAYRKPWAAVATLMGAWVGLLPGLAALAAIGTLAVLSRDGRLLRLTVGSGFVAALLFLRIQSPYLHHMFLIVPALAAPVAAALLLVLARTPALAVAGVAALGLVTMTPLIAAVTPAGFAPTAGQPAAPRTDLAELQRLRTWVDARARPDAKVCGLGSSYTFSGQLIDELWQLDPKRSPLVADPARRTSVVMADVDTVEGPPVSGLKDCAVMIVGDPVQTHINPTYQQTVILPSREMLEGVGIGAHYRPSGEAFHLQGGVTAVVFDRVTPLDDADIAALQDRWRAARRAAPWPRFPGVAAPC